MSQHLISEHLQQAHGAQVFCVTRLRLTGISDISFKT